MLILACLCFSADICIALESEDVLVVVNGNSPEGIDLSKYYMIQREIPKNNLIMVWTTTGETISRMDYRTQVAIPVKKYLEKKDAGHQIRCLVLMYGLPLKIAPSDITLEEKREIQRLEKHKQALESELKNIKKEGKRISKNVKAELNHIKKRITESRKTDQRASLDSEIALVLEDNYALSKWIPNPYFTGFRGKTLHVKKEHVLMVSRLDGPDTQTVKRMIDDSIKTEARGLSGVAYFDARWPETDHKNLSAYAFYDQSIHLSADIVKKSGRMPVVVNSAQGLFQAGECPDAALYCGWYSLANYVDAFNWRPGAIGYHIASAECSTLKQKGSNVWCKKMLEKGVAATIGPVYEPYIEAFPLPDLFFNCLVDAKLTLGECYLINIPYLSWEMVMLGDPLYRPFKSTQ